MSGLREERLYDRGIETPSATLRRPQSTSYSISDVIDLALRGRIRVPKFQRPFVWDQRDVRELFDSIWRGFPIGTLLFWSSPAENSSVKFGPIVVDERETTDALWVVDGQQRVTTLVAVLAESDHATVDPLFDLCFDLRKKKFVHAGKRPLPHSWLPLRVTLESRTLLAWLRENGDKLEPSELDLADEVAGAIRDYKLSAYIVDHDEEHVLRDVFDRVNSAGKPISRAQVFHALFGGDEELGSTGAVLEALAPLGFGDIDEQRVVQSLLAIRGGDVFRDLHDEFAADENRAEWFDAVEVALRETIRFLHKIGVPHLLLVPSTLPIPVLAAFFHLHRDPDPWTLRLLERWVWRGWAHGYGRSGQTPALRQAVRAVHPTTGDPADAPEPFEAVRSLLALVQDEPPPDFYGSSQTNSAAGRLALLALARRSPRTAGGQEIDIAHELQIHGVKAVTEVIPGFRSDLGARGFWPLESSPLTGHEAAEILASHLVTPQTALALRSADLDGALALRSRELAGAVETFLAVRLEHKALVTPPLDQLFVPEDEPDEYATSY
jgi:Protein of unknown function DUF262